MKKIFVLISFAVLFFTACKTDLDKDASVENKVYVKFSLNDSNSRTVLPQEFAKENLAYELSGLYEEENRSLGNWETYTQMQTAFSETIELESGNWLFILNAKKNSNVVLTATVSKEIVPGSNTVSFELEEYKSGKGTIEMDITFPAGYAEKAKIALYTITNEHCAAFDKEFTTFETKDSNNFIKYSDNTIPTGDYIVKLYLYQYASDTGYVNVKTEVVHVAAENISKGTFVFEGEEVEANIYEITYKLGEYSFKEGYESVTKYNSHQSVLLPGQESFADNVHFYYWYEEGDEEKQPVASIPIGNYGNKTYVLSAAVILSVDELSAYFEEHQNSELYIYIKDTDPSLSTLKELLQENSGKKISIDLSNCSKITGIGDSAFRGCSGLTSITIPESVTSIGNRAFFNCSGLTSITIPESVTSIYNDAFYNCRGLTSITIPDGVTSIGENAFSECRGLTSITIPDSVTRIDYSAFSGCINIEMVVLNNDIISLEKVLACPWKLKTVIIGNNVTSIGYSAFSGCSGLTSITIPDGVTSIGDSAFERCSGLTSMTIPDGVTSIGENAFSDCSGLTSITIPDSVTSIGRSAFYNCRRLTSITIPDGVTSIGRSAFCDCRGLTSITIPDGVTSIGENAFSGCSGLTSITIPDGVTSIGAYAFYACFGLTSITIPDGVTSIGAYAFSDCSGLTSITIPDSVTSIGNRAFSDCSGLTSITIPDSVTSIGDFAFCYCRGLTSITIPESVTSIGGSAFYIIPEVIYNGTATGAPWGADKVTRTN